MQFKSILCFHSVSITIHNGAQNKNIKRKLCLVVHIVTVGAHCRVVSESCDNNVGKLLKRHRAKDQLTKAPAEIIGG